MNNFLIETEDTLLIQKKEEELIKKNKFQDAEISSFDIEETPLENALEALDTYGFLSNQKVIIIKNIEVLSTLSNSSLCSNIYLAQSFSVPTHSSGILTIICPCSLVSSDKFLNSSFIFNSCLNPL